MKEGGEDVSLWWESLTGFEQFFWALAIPFSALFIVQIILLVIGIDHGGDIADIHDGSIDIGHESHIGHEHNTAVDSNAPLKLITLRNVIIFFTIFSWSGIVGTRNGFSVPVILAMGFILGGGVVLLLSIIFKSILKLTESGNMELKYAIGVTGEVYLTIPEGGKKGGKVQVVFQSSLKDLDAITYGDTLHTGTKVIVIGVEKDYLVVKALEEINKGEL